MFFTITKNKAEFPKKTVTYEEIRQQIRELAYKKWEQADRPWGRDKEFWLEAEKELFGENALQHGGYKINDFVIFPINSEIPVEVKL